LTELNPKVPKPGPRKGQGGVADAMPREDLESGGRQGWAKPWLPWAIGLGLLVAGVAVGWLSTYAALRPLLGGPAPKAPSPKPAPAAEEARVADAVSGGRAAVGDQVDVTWEVTNTGGTSWAPDSYRFVPEDERASVLPLPRTVSPGSVVTVRALLTVPEVTGSWQPTWALTGPKGPVPGGRLAVTVAVQSGGGGG
jgi:hypothetical protein